MNLYLFPEDVVVAVLLLLCLASKPEASKPASWLYNLSLKNPCFKRKIVGQRSEAKNRSPDIERWVLVDARSMATCHELHDCNGKQSELKLRKHEASWKAIQQAKAQCQLSSGNKQSQIHRNDGAKAPAESYTTYSTVNTALRQQCQHFGRLGSLENPTPIQYAAWSRCSRDKNQAFGGGAFQPTATQHIQVHQGLAGFAGSPTWSHHYNGLVQLTNLSEISRNYMQIMQNTDVQITLNYLHCPCWIWLASGDEPSQHPLEVPKQKAPEAWLEKICVHLCARAARIKTLCKEYE